MLKYGLSVWLGQLGVRQKVGVSLELGFTGYGEVG